MSFNKREFDSEEIYVACVCGNHDHMLIFSYEDDVDGFIVFQQLNHYMSFWKRLYHAIRYLMGKTSKHVHFTETCIEGDKFQTLMTRLFDHREKVLKDGKERPYIKETT